MNLSIYFKKTLLPAVPEENHHLLIPGIILLQHTLLQHKPVLQEVIPTNDKWILTMSLWAVAM